MNKFFIIFFACIALAACRNQRLTKSISASNTYTNPAYDDSILSQTAAPFLMPFNRIVNGAGTSISYGSPALENHTLDAVFLPNKKTIVIEDRYGIAFVDIASQKIIYRLAFADTKDYKKMMGVYSGIKAVTINNAVNIFWTASESSKRSSAFQAIWDGRTATIVNTFSFEAVAPSPLALPNDLAIQQEGDNWFLYVVLNGNSQLVKINLADKKTVWTTNTGEAPFGLTIANNKAYVTNWGGPVPTDTTLETAGIPYASVYTSKITGATSQGTVSVIDLQTGKTWKEIQVGLHPNAIIKSANGKLVYVANGNSDDISVINTTDNTVVDRISVRLYGDKDDLMGDSPNALTLNEDGNTLYVANGMDNAVAVIKLGKMASENGTGNTVIKGFVPTENYPAGILVDGANMYVCNLEGEGSRVKSPTKKAFTTHNQLATFSFIPLPDDTQLDAFTAKVKTLNMEFRNNVSKLLPRKGIAAKPVPERIGEPSSIKHVIYIIKENRTYDQVLGDVAEGRGDKSLCVFGDSVTPNEHRLVKQYGLLDNYYAAGKSSAEGHQWTDAAMVSDYVERNVRAWFRSYPHVQQDALVYNQPGFIWNNALDHGKTVRIYGEACEPHYDDNLDWTAIYKLYQEKKPFAFTNVSTISRVRPILASNYPGYDNHSINDQIRADAFIKELKAYENMPDDQWPQLLIVALPCDHTAGMRPGFPTPRAAVADNDLALGRIVEAITHSRFWDSTAVFVTEDDSQDGWDHISAYRTTGFVISPYSVAGKTIHTNYNQTCIVRTVEQILGIPPMNKIDATALPMFECFGGKPMAANQYNLIANKIPLNEMNKPVAMVAGKEKYFTLASLQSQFDHIDGGNDDLMNRIIWFSAMGKKPYPKKMTLGLKDDD